MRNCSELGKEYLNVSGVSNFIRVFRPITILVVEKEPCTFYLRWRSLYACPICDKSKATETHTDCVNGFKNVTYGFNNNCRNETGGTKVYDKFFVQCKVSTFLYFLFLLSVCNILEHVLK